MRPGRAVQGSLLEVRAGLCCPALRGHPLTASSHSRYHASQDLHGISPDLAEPPDEVTSRWAAITMACADPAVHGVGLTSSRSVGGQDADAAKLWTLRPQKQTIDRTPTAREPRYPGLHPAGQAVWHNPLSYLERHPTLRRVVVWKRCRSRYDGRDRQGLGDHPRAGVGGELPVISHRPGEGYPAGPLQRGDRERKDHQRGDGPCPAEAEGDSGCRKTYGGRKRELNAVHCSQLCTSRRLRAPDQSRAKATVGERVSQQQGGGSTATTPKSAGRKSHANTRFAPNPTTRLMKPEQLRKKRR